MTGLQLGRPTYPLPRRVLYRDWKRTPERHPPERFRLFVPFDTNQPIVRFAKVDNGRHALGVTVLGFVKTALNRQGARLVLQPCQPGERIEAKPSGSLHAGVPPSAASAPPSLWRIRAATATRPDAPKSVRVSPVRGPTRRVFRLSGVACRTSSDVSLADDAE